MILQPHFCTLIQRKWSNYLEKYLHSPVHGSIVHVAEIWKQLKYPPMDEWTKKSDIFVQWNIILL